MYQIVNFFGYTFVAINLKIDLNNGNNQKRIGYKAK